MSNVISAFNSNATNTSSGTKNTNTTNTNTNTTNGTNSTNSSNNVTLPVPDTPLNSAIGLLATMATTTNNQTSNGTNVFEGKNNSSDAAGYVGLSNFSVTSPPYVVKDCDQVFLVDAERIINIADFSKREKGLFTMSIYLANIFQAKDVNKLVDSITMERMVQAPTPIPGAPGCLDFAADGKNLAVCVSSKEIADQLIKAYYDFHNCRKGKKPLTPEDIIKMLEECQMKMGLSNKPNMGPQSMPGQPGNPTSTNNTLGAPSILTVLNGGNPAISAVNSPVVGPPKMEVGPYYANLKVPGTI